MRRVLLAWIGKGDVDAMAEKPGSTSRLALAVSSPGFGFDEIVVVNDLKREGDEVVKWLAARATAPVRACPQKLKNAVDYESVFRGSIAAIREALERHGAAAHLHFLLNSGTEVMGTVWLLIGKSRYPATLVAIAKEKQQLVEVPVPFNLAAEFLPEVLRTDVPTLEKVLGDRAPPTSAFKDIIGKSEAMTAVVDQARLFSITPYPVLLEGETGTGKEMFAAAIHASSNRRKKPFQAVNCGALPKDLIESILFGHVRGAFTGAGEAQTGLIREADEGTLFLDEVGELSREAQLKLLRFLEAKKVLPVGGKGEIPVDVRVVAATHRNLLEDVAAGNFREDLYYRLAVGTLYLPPLREREGDLRLLIDALLERTNEELRAEGLPVKELAGGARAVLMNHAWPGNVRELLNTLKRCAMLTPGPRIEATVAQSAIRRVPHRHAPTEVGPIPEGFNLDAHLAAVERSYIERALTQTSRVKTRAKDLLGFSSYQTMDDRLAAANKRLSGRVKS